MTNIEPLDTKTTQLYIWERFQTLGISIGRLVLCWSQPLHACMQNTALQERVPFSTSSGFQLPPVCMRSAFLTHSTREFEKVCLGLRFAAGLEAKFVALQI